MDHFSNFAHRSLLVVSDFMFWASDFEITRDLGAKNKRLYAIVSRSAIIILGSPTSNRSRAGKNLGFYQKIGF